MTQYFDDKELEHINEEEVDKVLSSQGPRSLDSFGRRYREIGEYLAEEDPKQFTIEDIEGEDNSNLDKQYTECLNVLVSLDLLEKISSGYLNSSDDWSKISSDLEIITEVIEEEGLDDLQDRENKKTFAEKVRESNL